jgi:hypothetical protein
MLSKLLGVESTFVIKNHLSLFPKRPLQAVLSARYPDRPAGHWVVMTTEICGVYLIALAYAWSHSSVSFFISTVGDTSPATVSYKTNFTNDFGEITSKSIPRPDLCDFIFGFLPVIDNHNKSRQHYLKLEKKWPTKDCWFRLICTLVGMSVVDLYRIYRFHDIKAWGTVTVVQFSDILCNGLKLRERKILPESLRAEASKGRLKRIAHDDTVSKETTKPMSKKARKGGRHNRVLVGSAVQKSCWMCRKYEKKYKWTAFECTGCATPLCFPHQSLVSNEHDGYLSCLDEHLNSPNDHIRCSGYVKRNFPQHLKIQK